MRRRRASCGRRPSRTEERRYPAPRSIRSFSSTPTSSPTPTGTDSATSRRTTARRSRTPASRTATATARVTRASRPTRARALRRQPTPRRPTPRSPPAPSRRRRRAGRRSRSPRTRRVATLRVLARRRPVRALHLPARGQGQEGQAHVLGARPRRGRKRGRDAGDSGLEGQEEKNEEVASREITIGGSREGREHGQEDVWADRDAWLAALHWLD